MRIMIPSEVTLISSTIPSDDAPMFNQRAFNTGEECIYDRYIWEKLTNTNLAPAWDGTFNYWLGDIVSFSANNYVANAKVISPNPSASSKWTLQTVSAWLPTTVYSAGDIRTFNGQTYLCIAPHTSGVRPLNFVSGALFNVHDIVYNRKVTNNMWIDYYLEVMFTYQYWGSMPVGFPFTIALDVNTLKITESYKYWQNITNADFSNTTLYKSSSVVKEGSLFYAANTDILPDSPSISTFWNLSVGDTPVEGLNWKRVRATNRWRMFDQFLNTISTADTTMTFEISSYATRALFIGNITADNVLIEVFDGANLIESKAYKMRSLPKKWSDFIFGDWRYKDKGSIVYDRQTLYRSVTYRITASKNYGNVSIGMVLAGSSSFIGNVGWGFRPGFIDYSTVTTVPTSGETYLSKGKVVKAPSVEIKYDTSDYDTLRAILDEAAGQPIVIYDESGLKSLKFCGYVKKFEPLISGPIKSTADIDFIELI